MSVERVELLPQVVVALNQGFIAVPHSIQVALMALSQVVQVLDSLVSHAGTPVKVLIFNDLVVFLAEQSLLEFDSLGI